LSKDEVHRVRPGRAFWLISRSSHRVATRVLGLSTRTDEDFEIILSPGWNQIGNPFAFDVAWEDVGLDAPPAVVETPLHWNSSSQYEDATLLEPFEGYFVMNNSEQEVAMRIPPVEADPSKGKPPASNKTYDWKGEIVAMAGDRIDVAYMGIVSGASADWDAADRSDPPGFPERSITPYFPHTEWKTHAKAFSTDVHSLGAPESKPFTTGHAWRFDVAKNFTDLDGGDPVLLLFGGIDAIPEGLRVMMLDHDLGREIDLRETRQYRFVLGERGLVPDSEARFAFVVGDDAFVQDQLVELSAVAHETRLFQNRPNPFRQGTLFRYDLGAHGQAEVVIYDVRGRLVHAMRQQLSKPGRYEFAWDGRDTQGLLVPPGLYFYRLHTPRFSETRKMLIVR
jgi:hypothetical protein